MPEMIVVNGTDLPSFPLAPGIDIRPLCGELLNINVVELRAAAATVAHRHTEEQMGYVVSGTCVFSDGNREWSLGPGDVYHAPPDVPHGVTAGPEGCVILDVFSPPKAEVLKLLGR